MKLTSYLLNVINLLRCRKVIRRARNLRFKYETAICALAKNEELYLKEWLDHHYALGFDHVYLIDNNDKPGLRAFLSDYLERALLTIVDFQGIRPSNQSAAYEYCLANYAKETRWMAFIDIDEFIVLNKDTSIRTFLERYVSFPSVLMNWIMYGSNNQVYYKPGGVKDRFPLPAKEGQAIESMNMCFKSIIQTIVYTTFTDCSFRSAHRWSFPLYNEYGKLVLGESSNHSANYIQLNHYWSKSYEEFINRCSRGETIGGNKNKMDFFRINPSSMMSQIEEYERQCKANKRSI